MNDDKKAKLREALVEAFPKEDNLDDLITFHLGEKMDEIAPGTGLSARIRNLITWAESRNNIPFLIKKATKANSKNTALKNIAQEFQVYSDSLPWNSYIHKLNYTDAVETFNHFLSQQDEKFYAGFFLMQNEVRMGGKWCIKRIRELLQEETRNFRHHSVEFTIADEQDEKSILRKLGSYFNVYSEDIEEISEIIIGKICDSVRSGSIFLFEVRGIELLLQPAETILWLLNNFWNSLVKKIAGILALHPRVRMFMIIATENSDFYKTIPVLTDGNKENFQTDKIIEMPLTHWTYDEIQRWLQSYSELPADKINILLNTVYRYSDNGTPLLVYESLTKYWVEKN